MTFGYWSLPIAMLLPIIFAGIGKASGKYFDNAKPREWFDRQQGKAKRANWAQQNSYEAFPPYAAAVVVAHLTGTPQMTIDLLAVMFLVSRVGFGYCYIADRSTARSFFWLGGFLATILLFVL